MRTRRVCLGCHGAVGPDAQRCPRCGGDVQAVPDFGLDESAAADRTTDHRWTPEPGPEALGRYRLLEELGRGAFGTVWRARDTLLHREVALKVPRFPAERADLVERFLREARTAARLSHPHIVPVHDCGQDGGRYFIASELIDGETLAQRLGRTDVRQAAGWGRDLALALHYAHGQAVVHRDVKPANVLLDRTGRVRLTDFGLAKWSAEGPDDGPADATRAGAVLGTPAYMSPEQARGEPATPASDQYGLGVVLYELLAGRRPFEGSARQIMDAAADPDAPAPALRHFAPSVPANLEWVVMKALEKRPEDRYASASDFAVDLQRWLNDDPLLTQARSAGRRPRPAEEPTPAGEKRVRRCRRCERVSPAHRPLCQYCGGELGGSEVAEAPGRRAEEATRQAASVRPHALRRLAVGLALIAAWALSLVALVGLLNLLGPMAGPAKVLVLIPVGLAAASVWGLVQMYVGLFELATGGRVETLNGVPDLSAREWTAAGLTFTAALLPTALGLWRAVELVAWAYEAMFQ